MTTATERSDRLVALAVAAALCGCSSATSVNGGVGGKGTGGFGAGGSTAQGGSPGTGGAESAIGGRGGSSAGGASGATGQSGAGGETGSGGTGAGGGAGGAGGGAGGGGGANGVSALLVPAQGALLGAFVGTGTLAGFEAELGRPIAINHNFVGWSQDWTPMLSSLAAGARIPLVTWEAWDGSVGAPLTSIIGGTYDSMITARAQVVRAFGKKFFLRWGHEMNGNWYP
jgi:hypothetical protein